MCLIEHSEDGDIVVLVIMFGIIVQLLICYVVRGVKTSRSNCFIDVQLFKEVLRSLSGFSHVTFFLSTKVESSWRKALIFYSRCSDYF